MPGSPRRHVTTEIYIDLSTLWDGATDDLTLGRNDDAAGCGVKARQGPVGVAREPVVIARTDDEKHGQLAKRRSGIEKGSLPAGGITAIRHRAVIAAQVAG